MPTSPLIDRSLPALAKGYTWLPGLLRDRPDGVTRTRVMGKPALVVRGPEAVRFLYDEDHVRRGGALPEPVLRTGAGARGGFAVRDVRVPSVRTLTAV